jgi:uncharacterized protein YbaP (TraB family)
MLAQSEPWLAAITVELMMLYRIGFNPLLGIEMTMTTRAAQDEAQREMLLQTLAEGAALSESIDELIDAWRYGDTTTLEEGLLSSIGEQSVLSDALVTNRNRRWAETIATWLDDERDYLVVVGALHLVGDEGVPNLLANKGIGIHQLREQAGLR